MFTVQRITNQKYILICVIFCWYSKFVMCRLQFFKGIGFILFVKSLLTEIMFIAATFTLIRLLKNQIYKKCNVYNIFTQLMLNFVVPGCHVPGYNSGKYMQYRNVNTQVAEQRNTTLKKPKSMLSYMNIDIFMIHLKIFMWFRSMIALTVLDPNPRIDNMDVFRRLSKLYFTFKA